MLLKAKRLVRGKPFHPNSKSNYLFIPNTQRSTDPRGLRSSISGLVGLKCITGRKEKWLAVNIKPRELSSDSVQERLGLHEPLDHNKPTGYRRSRDQGSHGRHADPQWMARNIKHRAGENKHIRDSIDGQPQDKTAVLSECQLPVPNESPIDGMNPNLVVPVKTEKQPRHCRVHGVPVVNGNQSSAQPER